MKRVLKQQRIVIFRINKGYLQIKIRVRQPNFCYFI